MVQDAIATLLGREFARGLGFGGIALAISVFSGLAWRRRRSTALPIAGVFLALATLIAMPIASPVPVALWWGVGLLAAGGALFQMVPTLRGFAPLLAAPGAWLVSTQSVVLGAGWVRWFVFLTIVVAGPLSASFAVQARTGLWTPALFAIFTVGIFLSVPDTEESLVLLGVAIPMALLSLPRSPVFFGAAGAYAAVGVALWVIVQGGFGRPASIIGASGCLGLLVVEPVAKWFTEHRESLLDRFQPNLRGLVMVTLIQLVLVVAVARLAGVSSSIIVASVFAGGLLTVTTLVMILSEPGRSHPPDER